MKIKNNHFLLKMILIAAIPSVYLFTVFTGYIEDTKIQQEQQEVIKQGIIQRNDSLRKDIDSLNTSTDSLTIVNYEKDSFIKDLLR